jgi:hypothetical protein
MKRGRLSTASVDVEHPPSSHALITQLCLDPFERSFFLRVRTVSNELDQIVLQQCFANNRDESSGAQFNETPPRSRMTRHRGVEVVKFRNVVKAAGKAGHGRG